MENILVADASRYVGQYVITEDFGKIDVVAASECAEVAYTMAIELGYKDPVIIYVPKEDE